MSQISVWNPESGTRSLEPGVWNSESGTWSLEPGVWNPKSGSRSLEPGAWDLKSGVRTLIWKLVATWDTPQSHATCLSHWRFETSLHHIPVIENPRAQLNQIPRHIFVDWAITAKCCLADEIRGWSACRPVKSDSSVTPLQSSVRPEVAVRPKKAVARVQRTPVQETRPYDPYAIAKHNLSQAKKVA